MPLSVPLYSVREAFASDPDDARAKEWAEQFGVPGHGDLPALLADDPIDVVVNLTAPSAHVQMGLAALDAGCRRAGEPLAATL